MPAFSKSLKSYDIESRLQVPADWLRVLPAFGEGNYEIQLDVVDGSGLFWQFWCTIRRHGPRKPSLQSGEWLRYVRYKNLEVGDLIILDTVENQFRGTKLRIRALKFAPDGQWRDV